LFCSSRGSWPEIARLPTLKTTLGRIVSPISQSLFHYGFERFDTPSLNRFPHDCSSGIRGLRFDPRQIVTHDATLETSATGQ
jgi:hypothetical protein